MDISDFKKSKFFYLRDVFVYLFLAVFVFILFLCFVIIPSSNNDKSNGFIVEYDGKTIITHYYGTEDFDIDVSFINLVDTTKTETGFHLTIYTSTNRDGYNLLAVNESEKSIKMLDSDCRSKQCTYLHEIGSNGIIYCAPRLLKISPINGSGNIPPITG